MGVFRTLQPPAQVVSPIRPENLSRYPADWAEISKAVREEARWRCEGSPAFPDCQALDSFPHPVTGAKVVLTVGHLDHQPENCERANLRAWCQRCHNTYDADHRRQTKIARRHEEAETLDLFED